jgi:membrane protein DedA with SNARE-associated domain
VSDFITGDLTEWVIDVIDRLGYPGVALLALLENLFPPIPSEVVLPAAGIHSRDGRSAMLAMIVAATIGSVVGAWFLYAFAAWIGPDRLRGFVVRRGRWFALNETDLDKAEEWFDRRQDAAVLLCRCIPLVRSLVSIPAGFRRMNVARFTIYTAIGSLVWNATLITLGYAARQHWGRVQDVMSYVQYGVIAVGLGAVGWFLWRRVVRAAREPTGDRVV